MVVTLQSGDVQEICFGNTLHGLEPKSVAFSEEDFEAMGRLGDRELVAYLRVMAHGWRVKHG